MIGYYVSVSLSTLESRAVCFLELHPCLVTGEVLGAVYQRRSWRGCHVWFDVSASCLASSEAHWSGALGRCVLRAPERRPRPGVAAGLRSVGSAPVTVGSGLGGSVVGGGLGGVSLPPCVASVAVAPDSGLLGPIAPGRPGLGPRLRDSSDRPPGTAPGTCNRLSLRLMR